MILKFILLFFCLNVFYVSSLKISKLPDYIKPCRRSDPKLNECVVTSAKNAIPYVVKANPDLKSPSLDPMIIEEIRIRQGSSQVGTTILLKNIEIIGLKNAVMFNADYHLENPKNLYHTWNFDVPKLEIQSKYNISGQILLLPITGSGNSNITMNKVKAKYYCRSELYKGKGGKMYMNITEGKLEFEPERTYFNLENLFNGDKLLGDNMNAFLNENWKDVLQDIFPTINKAFTQQVTGILSRFAKYLPYDSIYLP